MTEEQLSKLQEIKGEMETLVLMLNDIICAELDKQDKEREVKEEATPTSKDIMGIFKDMGKVSKMCGLETEKEK